VVVFGNKDVAVLKCICLLSNKPHTKEAAQLLVSAALVIYKLECYFV